MLEIRNLTKSFGSGGTAVTALHEVAFSIAEGEFFTLLGPSGCGKTTLLRLIAGFEPPSGGALVLDGRDVAHLPPNKRPVNTVFQNYALFPHMTFTLHFHNTRSMAQANALAAISAGIDRFDASLGGIRGCPYAPGASGNACTEDMVHMLELEGYNTGIDQKKLLSTSHNPLI